MYSSTRAQITRAALDGLSFFFFLSQDHVPRSLYESIRPLVETKSNYLFQPMESFLRITDQDTIGRSRSIYFVSLFLPHFLSPHFFPPSRPFSPRDDKRLRARSQTRLLLARLVPWGIHPERLITKRLRVLNNSSEKFYCLRAFVNGDVSRAIIHRELKSY